MNQSYSRLSMGALSTFLHDLVSTRFTSSGLAAKATSNSESEKGEQRSNESAMLCTITSCVSGAAASSCLSRSACICLSASSCLRARITRSPNFCFDVPLPMTDGVVRDELSFWVGLLLTREDGHFVSCNFLVSFQRAREP